MSWIFLAAWGREVARSAELVGYPRPNFLGDYLCGNLEQLRRRIREDHWRDFVGEVPLEQVPLFDELGGFRFLVHFAKSLDFIPPSDGSFPIRWLAKKHPTPVARVGRRPRVRCDLLASTPIPISYRNIDEARM
jgi:hypothetical protein